MINGAERTRTVVDVGSQGPSHCRRSAVLRKSRLPQARSLLGSFGVPLAYCQPPDCSVPLNENDERRAGSRPRQAQRARAALLTSSTLSCRSPAAPHVSRLVECEPEQPAHVTHPRMARAASGWVWSPAHGVASRMASEHCSIVPTR
jgi:hypothetical protein